MSRNYYKKKGAAGIDLKDRRRLRRSIHQKEERDKKFLARRDVDSTIGPQESNVSGMGQSKCDSGPSVINPKQNHTAKAKKEPQLQTPEETKSRLEMLKKWREEKEMKRKVEMMNKKRTDFKVFKVVPDKAPSWSTSQKTLSSSKVPSNKPGIKKTTLSKKEEPTFIPQPRRSTRIASKVDSNFKAAKPKLIKATSTTAVKPEPKAMKFPSGVKVFKAKPQPSLQKRGTTQTTSAKKNAVSSDNNGFTFRMKMPLALKTSAVTRPIKPAFASKVSSSFQPAVKNPCQQITPVSKPMRKRTGVSTNTESTTKLRTAKRTKSPDTVRDDKLNHASPMKQRKLREMVQEGCCSTRENVVETDSEQMVHKQKAQVEEVQLASCVKKKIIPQTENFLQNTNMHTRANDDEPRKEDQLEKVTACTAHGEGMGTLSNNTLPDKLSDECQPETARDDQQPISDEDKEGAVHYQKTMDDEREKLDDLCSKWSSISQEEELREDVKGEIRCTIGKAQLLMNQRFKQFAGLVQKCADGSGEKRTHASDLQGFWEMVYFQVEDVHQMFKTLEELQVNNWERKEKEAKKVKKIVKKKVSAPSKANDEKRKAARERLAAIKAAMKSKTTEKKEAVVFEGGFFKVESPVKVITPHCAAGTPVKSSPGLRKSLVLKSANSTPVNPENRAVLQVKAAGAATPILRRSPRTSASPLIMSSFPPEKNTPKFQKSLLATSGTPTIVSDIVSPTKAIEFEGTTPPIFSPASNSEESVGLPRSGTGGMINQFRSLGLRSAGSTRRINASPKIEKVTGDNDMVTCLKDLGFSPLSGKNSNKTQRRSTRLNKENIDLSTYLVSSVIDLNDQAEDHMKTEPTEQLSHLGVSERRISMMVDMSAYLMPSAADEESPVVESGSRTPFTDRNVASMNSPLNHSKDNIGTIVSPLGDLPSPSNFKPRRSLRIRPGRVSSFTPPRRSMLCKNTEGDLISFE